MFFFCITVNAVFFISSPCCPLPVDENAVDVFVFILYTAILLNLFISFNSSLVDFQSLPICKSISSASRDHFTSPFPIWVSFISFSSLITLAGNSSTVSWKWQEQTSLFCS